MKADEYIVLIYFRLQQTVIFDFTFILMSDNVVSSPDVLRDPENMDKAVGMSLLLCTQDEIYVMSYSLPVTGRYI